MSLISVIIPTFNRAHTLERAIDSVLSQSFRQFELIVVDDNSNDETQKLLRTYQVDDKLKVITLSETRGVSYARNRGFDASTGQWIALLDSDDEWKFDKLQKQYQFILENPEIKLIHGEEI